MEIRAQTVFPLLKTRSWAQERALEWLPFSSADEQNDHSPVIVVSIDDGETLAYLPEGGFEGETRDEIFGHAFNNLSRKVGKLSWQTLDFSEKLPAMRALSLGGDFYASEALLVDEKIDEALERLGAKKLLVCRPVRGQLLAIALDDNNTSAVQTFLSACASHFKEAQARDDQVALDFRSWVIEEGQSPQPYIDVLVQSSQEELPAEQNLYTPVQIGVASFFGTALAGFYMLYSNYQSVGKPILAKRVTLSAVFIMPLLMMAVILTPGGTYDRLFPVASGLVMGVIANRAQGSMIQDALRSRSVCKQSFLRACLVTILSLLCVFLSLLGAVSMGVVPESW
ncbi:hypothetical protein [Marinobacter sp. bablab_jr008]|uniref:hypothetical protein n=1 Tax=Marinobacter sp. bablab_jr008 TaxID=2755064 RepID=UPI0018F1D0CF|nr:hypothetical protein [Marinobacter sp. bablab_jr008]MEC9039923.1 hypothetical protein [Pseudomonadota bacterium]MEC9385239.1 hypothetical protein [Pseudomonadota bacterium]|tara:strand:+ start:2977 stop:3996 length:1020 start_codon:yes stop_codon:yes gene_type:complete